jgi:hypothetical protein
MSGGPADNQPALYDRQLLLLGAMRNTVLDLADVRRYGMDSYRDPDYVSLYGMRPADWDAAGIRLLGRTAVECTRDSLADAIARDIAGVALTAPLVQGPLVIDLFAGSGNTLFWILGRLPDARGVGFELDAPTFELTRQNLAILSAPIELSNVDFVAGLGAVTVAPDQMIIAFVAPPWGDALDPAFGLDLRRTTPPIGDILGILADHLAGHRLLVAIQVYERIDRLSLAELEERFDWSALRIYDLNEPGQNHGILLGTLGWSP